MFGISAGEIPSNLLVGLIPKTGEILRYLHGTAAGGEKVKEQGHSSLGDRWNLGPAEELLDSRGEDRMPIFCTGVCIVDFEGSLGRDFDVGRHVCVEYFFERIR